MKHRSKERGLASAVGATILIACLLVVGWKVHQARECEGVRRQAAFYEGLDVEVRRASDGSCYLCRQDGALYDIVFDRCPTPGVE